MTALLLGSRFSSSNRNKGRSSSDEAPANLPQDSPEKIAVSARFTPTLEMSSRTKLSRGGRVIPDEVSWGRSVILSGVRGPHDCISNRGGNGAKEVSSRTKCPGQRCHPERSVLGPHDCISNRGVNGAKEVSSRTKCPGQRCHPERSVLGPHDCISNRGVNGVKDPLFLQIQRPLQAVPG